MSKQYFFIEKLLFIYTNSICNYYKIVIFLTWQSQADSRGRIRSREPLPGCWAEPGDHRQAGKEKPRGHAAGLKAYAARRGEPGGNGSGLDSGSGSLVFPY
jgi:hypothetical protein